MTNPQDFVKKWSQRTGSATDAYVKGIQQTTESPMEKAASRADKYAAGVQEAVASGRFQDGLRSVSISEWKDKATKLGAGRLASGVKEAESRMLAFAQQFLPFQEQVTSMVRQMDDSSLESRLQRMIAQVRGTAEFKYKGR